MATRTFTSAFHDVAAAARALDTNLTQPAAAVVFDGAQSVVVKARSSNSGSVYIGPTGVTVLTGYELQPGASVTLDQPELGNLYSIGTAGDKLTLLGGFFG